MTGPATVELMVSASWLLPMAPFGRVLDGAALAVRDGRIVALGPAAELKASFRAARTLELPGHALLPGFVNCHTHAAMSLLRGVADDLPLQSWLEDHIWPLERRWLSETFVRDGTRLACLEMIETGTTCFADMYFYPEVAAEVARAAGLRAQLAFPVMDLATAWGAGSDEYLHKGLALHDAYRSYERIQIAFGPHAPYSANDRTLARVATLAAELQAPIQIHAHETQREVDEAVAATGERPLARLARLGILGPLTQCVHMTALNDDDRALVAQYGASVVHCPESNMKLASGACPVQSLLDQGVTVALGTDGAASNNDIDMLGELASAALLGKLTAADAAAVSAHQALHMATLGGARALGLERCIGSLEVGKDADFIAIDLGAARLQPRFDVAALLVYANRAARVNWVFAGGRELLGDGEPRTLKRATVANAAAEWRAKIAN